MERRQRAIKRHLSVYCQENHRKSGLPSLGHIFVTKTPQLLYCMVPKVASRQWRSLLARLNRTRLQPQHNPTEVKYFFSRYYKFMFVREPFERLLSAYKDKFVNPVRPSAYRNYQSYRRKIVANFRRNATQEALSAAENPTFPEFIEYILKQGVHEGLDQHWNLYEGQCRPCSVGYNFIGRYEFLIQDANYVLRKAGVRNSVRFPTEKHSKTSDELLKYYSQIPLAWIEQLGGIYRSNFEMFGYPFPGPLEPLFLNATGSSVAGT